MTAHDLLLELRSLDVVLSAHGDRLRYDAPAGVVTAERKTALRENKAELLRLLCGEVPDGGSSSATPWPPRPAELASWPGPWRERWGRRAAKLEDGGLPWQKAERQAFEETRLEREATGATTIEPVVNEPDPPLAAFDPLPPIKARKRGRRR